MPIRIKNHDKARDRLQPSKDQGLSARLIISTDEDYVKYLHTREPNAEHWLVFVCGDDGSEVEAPVVETKTQWISPYHRIEPGERAWIVDSYLLPDGANPEEIRIYIPGVNEPLRVVHPHRGHFLHDRRTSRDRP
jgi:hypothetical protein